MTAALYYLVNHPLQKNGIYITKVNSNYPATVYAVATLYA